MESTHDQCTHTHAHTHTHTYTCHCWYVTGITTRTRPCCIVPHRAHHLPAASPSRTSRPHADCRVTRVCPGRLVVCCDSVHRAVDSKRLSEGEIVMCGGTRANVAFALHCRLFSPTENPPHVLLLHFLQSAPSVAERSQSVMIPALVRLWHQFVTDCLIAPAIQQVLETLASNPRCWAGLQTHLVPVITKMIQSPGTVVSGALEVALELSRSMIESVDLPFAPQLLHLYAATVHLMKTTDDLSVGVASGACTTTARPVVCCAVVCVGSCRSFVHHVA